MAVQMMLGDFPFTLATAEYDKLSRSLSWRWAEHERHNRKSAMQFMGAVSEDRTYRGTLHIEKGQDLSLPDAMKAEADKGEPLILLSSNDISTADYMGQWVIRELTFDESDVLGDGTPLTIDFTIKLKEFGEDQS